MKLIKFTKDNVKKSSVWVNADQIGSIKEAGDSILISCADGLGYRLECPPENKDPKGNAEFYKFKEFLTKQTILNSKAIID